MKDKKETAATAAELLKLIENGELTVNQAREKLGLEPINDPSADKLLKKV